MREITFNINNMVCLGCAEKINDILKAVPGVEEVKTKVMKKQVWIKYYPETLNTEMLKETLIKSGYNPTEA